MSDRTITVSLKSDGKTLSSLDLRRGCEPVLVGRSHACALRAPGDDNSVSGRHARLFWKGGTLFLEDMGSRNGIYFNGKRMTKPVKIEPDGLYAIGNCLLSATRDDGRKGAASTGFHQLEFLNGDRARQCVDVKPKPGNDAFLIGLDPGCDICLPDMLVSRHHARLAVRPGGDCWIADEDSRNGTYVNGEKLGAKERLLRDGDKISIAYFDLRFLDRNVSHTRAYLWTKLGALAVTLGVIAAAWVAYQSLRLVSSDYRSLAEKAATEGQFDKALAYLDEAVMAKNASAEKMQNDALKLQIRRWRDTVASWNAAMTDLDKGRLGAARRTVEQLMGDPQQWTWNGTSAQEMRGEAEFANSFLRQYFDATIDLAEAEKDVEVKGKVEGRLAAMDAYLKANRARILKTSYLAPGMKGLSALRAKLDSIRGGIARIDAALDSIDSETPTFTKAVEELGRVAASESLSAGVRGYARSLLPTCREFLKTEAFLDREKTMVTDMQFAEALKGSESLPLPESADCARHPKFSTARAAFQKMHAGCLREVNVLGPMVRNLEAAGIKNGEKGHLVSFVVNPASWDKALSFDCFQNRFPVSSRVDPTGVYDELLGIEYTYENLRELPKPAGRKNAVMMNFIPKCQAAKAAFDQVKIFLAFMDRPEGAAFRSGRLGALYALGAQILADREKLVSALKKRSEGVAAGSSNRAKIVAGYYAEYFADEPSYADLRALEMAYRKLQTQMNALNERYDAEPDPEVRLKIRKMIIANGIPGMEAVRMRWVEVEAE